MALATKKPVLTQAQSEHLARLERASYQIGEDALSVIADCRCREAVADLTSIRDLVREVALSIPKDFDDRIKSCKAGEHAADGDVLLRLRALKTKALAIAEEHADITAGRMVAVSDDDFREPPREVPEPKPAKGKRKKSISTTTLQGPDGKIVDPLTELAAAYLLADMHGGNLLHSSALGWLWYDGKRYKRDPKAAERAAHDLGAAYRKRVADLGIDNPDVVRAWFSFAKRLESAKGITGVLTIARSLDHINADALEFDKHKWLLNCENGTIDLTTGILREHRREDLITKLCPTPFVPHAACPRFDQFINEVFSGDKDLIAYIHFLFGYALSGSDIYDLIIFFLGGGANGKTTLLRTFQEVLGGDFAKSIDPEVLLLQRNARHSVETAALRGARFVIAAESGESRRLDEAKLKAISGGDKMSARELYHSPFEFDAEFKLFLCSNARPVLRDDSDGLWRRLRLVNFERQFMAGDADPNLSEKLLAERAGILRWAVAGAVVAHKGEPPVPEKVRAATDDYRHEQDTLAGFLEDECELYTGAQTPIKDLYRRYQGYMNGKCEAQKAFGDRLVKRGFARDKGAKGVRVHIGIALQNKDLLTNA